MSALPSWPPHPLTVEQVLAMVASGILDRSEPVELLDGVLTHVSPQGPEHSWLTGRIATLMRRAYGDAGVTSEEKPIVTDDTSLPEPDVSVIRGPRQRDRHPRGDECVLVVEIAVSSQHTDRQKAALYARGGVPVYWLLDVPQRRLTVYEGPRPDGTWRQQRTYDADESVGLPGVATTLTVATLLGD